MLESKPPHLFSWLSIVIGLVFAPRNKALGPISRWQALRGIGVLLAWTLGGIGLLNIWAVYSSEIPAWLRSWHGQTPYAASEPWLAFWSGVTLFALAIGLYRRKRVSWGLMLALTLIAATYQAYHGGGLRNPRAVAGLVIAAGLLVLWPEMRVRSDMIAVRRAVFILLGASICVYLLKTLALPGGDMLFAAAWVYFLVACLRPAPLVGAVNPASRRVAKDIVERYGCSSMAFLTLSDDKHYFFSRGGSLIAYALHNRVAVILGDPVGPFEDAMPAIQQFRAHCAVNDWLPAFCLTRPDYLDLYRQAGLSAICLGHEAVVDLHSFDLRGRASSSYRKRYQRMLNEGYRCEVVEPPHSAEFIAQLRLVSNEWLAAVSGEEKRFFLGYFNESHLRSNRIAVVYTPENHISAFANLVSEYQLNETSIDLARFRSQSISGTMDFLFVSLFFWARDQGFDSFNLGLNALAGVGLASGSPWIEFPLYLVYKYGDRLYNFKGIYEFKRKFHPYWQPQFLVYPGLLNLPAVGLAMAGVNSGSGFLVSFLKKRRPGRRSALRRSVVGRAAGKVAGKVVGTVTRKKPSNSGAVEISNQVAEKSEHKDIDGAPHH